MLYRESADSEPLEVTTNELRARVRAGLVAPTALVRDPLLTPDEWWTIDNLRLFHNSPFGGNPSEKVEFESRHSTRTSPSMSYTKTRGSLLRIPQLIDLSILLLHRLQARPGFE